ncbi:MAG: hypothetical protein KAG61_12870 [Bacteriovoracaceae bacterium]|nr:hypothetical protein [Bacteriovoracaceae bacterium]
MQDNDYLLTKAAKIGEDVKEMVEVILLRGRGYVDTRSIWGILSLDKDHGKDQVNLACKYALECDRLGYQGVMRFINIMPKDKETIEKSSKNKFLRDPKEYGITIH